MKEALIIGNGVSARALWECGFHHLPRHLDVYATSLAFRFCDELQWQPTYYVFADPKSVTGQRYNLQRCIHAYEDTKRWYLCCNVHSQAKEVTATPVSFFASNKVQDIPWSGSGTAALRIAIESKQYNRIYMVGIDMNYIWDPSTVRFLAQTPSNYDCRAEIVQDIPYSPNYFYTRYLREGDIISWNMGKPVTGKCKDTQALFDKAKQLGIECIDYSVNNMKRVTGVDLALDLFGVCAASHLDPHQWTDVVLHNACLRQANVFSEQALEHYRHEHSDTKLVTFATNHRLKYKHHIITLVGYTDPNHTNWYVWNRFRDVFQTIGYRVEWVQDVEVQDGPPRVYVVWGEPDGLDLWNKGYLSKEDVVFQKLTSISAKEPTANWGDDAYAWSQTWHWPLYKRLETLVDHGVDAYGFGCQTIIDDFPEKQRICTKLKDRIHWLPWGGTPFTWIEVLSAQPVVHPALKKRPVFVGSKWGVPGRGNGDVWDKYLNPLNVEAYGRGTDHGPLSDNKMIRTLKSHALCPIVHAPSWQAERGVQDRFYTVFLSGRFGVCDNLGAIDMFGPEVADICTTDPDDYVHKSRYYQEHVEEQQPFIEYVQTRIKQDFNFYVAWLNVLTQN